MIADQRKSGDLVIWDIWGIGEVTGQTEGNIWKSVQKRTLRGFKLRAKAQEPTAKS